MKKVILYNPKVDFHSPDPFPFAVASIGSCLKFKGHQVKIVDARVDKDSDKKALDNLDDAIFFGITCMSGFPIKDSLRMAGLVRKKNPNIPLVWGGFHPNLWEDTIKHPLVDIIVRGQGEETVVELTKALEKGASLNKILGITFKKNGKIIKNPSRPVRDINELPPIDYEIVDDIKKYIKSDVNTRTLDYLSSRYCPHSCSFCCMANLFGRKWFAYSAKRVVNEIGYLVKRYKLNGIRFMDDNFFVDAERVEKICDGFIKHGIKIKWQANARLDYIARYSDELLLKISKAGFDEFCFGIESGNPEVLKKLKKELTVDQIFTAIEKLKRLNLKGGASLMMGLPYDTPNELSEMMDFLDRIHKINPDFKLFVFIYSPDPKTELYKEVLKKGFKPPKTLEDWANFNYRRGNTSWVSKKDMSVMETLVPLVEYRFCKRRITKTYQRIGAKLLTWDAKLRWKYRFFNFPIEWRAYSYLLRKLEVKV